MPNRPLQPCTSPGCPNRVTAGRCDEHRRHHKSQRATWTQLYGTNWPRVRLDYLERHPFCALCPRQATIPDHYPVGIKELRRRRVGDPHADHRLRPLCQPCHAGQTAAAQPSGWHERNQ